MEPSPFLVEEKSSCFVLAMLSPFFFGSMLELAKNRKRLLVVREQKTKKENRECNGNELFWCKWHPYHGQIAGTNSNHPSDVKPCSKCDKQICPTIGDEPCNAIAKQIARVEKGGENVPQKMADTLQPISLHSAKLQSDAS